jgi:hypothetical protein
MGLPPNKSNGAFRAKRRGDTQMAGASQQATRGYALADAEHVLKAVIKHWTLLQSLGAIESECKRFAQTIAQGGQAIAEAESGSPIALEDARQILKDQVGAYRSAAKVVVHGFDGRDAKAETALKMKGPFPANDVQLAAYVSGLAAPLRSYAAKLTARGFGKDKQAQLVEAAAFTKA